MRIVTSTMVLLFCSAAWAAPTLDQSQYASNGGTAISKARSFGQTFTAGLSGQLMSVDMMFSSMGSGPYYPATVQIQTASGGLPTGTVLGSLNFPTGFNYGLNAIDLSSFDISVTAGSQYAIVLSNDEVPVFFPSDGIEVKWWAPGWDTDPYAGGALVENNGSGWQVLHGIFGDADAYFATWVETAAIPVVPAPGVLLLVAVGSALVTGLRRRRLL